MRRALASVGVVLAFGVLAVGCGYAPYIESDPTGANISVNDGRSWPAPTPCQVAVPVDANTTSFKITVWKAGCLPETQVFKAEDYGGPPQPNWPQRMMFRLKAEGSSPSSPSSSSPSSSPPPPKKDPPRPTTTTTRYCTGCGNALDPSSPTFCAKCGKKQTGMRDCPTCGEKRPDDASECPHCGVKPGK